MDYKFKIPDDLHDQTKAYMARLLELLDENGTGLNGLDEAALMLLARTYDNYIVATETLASQRRIVKEINARNTMITKSHPAVKQQLDAGIELKKLLIEFGLTPRSRGADGGKKKNPLEELFEKAGRT